MSISVKSSGTFQRTGKFLDRILKRDIYRSLARYAEEGTRALANATPADTGLSANAWRARVVKKFGAITIEWYNENTVQGTPVVIWIQYGHATGTGGYVNGRDFINPTMRPLFDQIANEVWREVTKS